MKLAFALPFLLPTQAERPEDVFDRALQTKAAELGLTAADLAGAKTTDVVPSKKSGVFHVYKMQTHRGIPVANARSNADILGDKVLSLHAKNLRGNLASKVDKNQPAITASEAINIAAASLDDIANEFDLDLITAPRINDKVQEQAFGAVKGLSQDSIPAKLAYYVSEDRSTVYLTWELVVRLYDNERWMQMWVSTEEARVVGQANWITGATYSVYPHPREAPANLTAVPLNVYNIEPMTLVVVNDPNWLSTNGGSTSFSDTRGNNVAARLDLGGNNAGTVTPMTSANTFDYRSDNLLSLNPSDWADAAVTNLFYWNNIIHDILYQYGFDEASGNFQENNFGMGGAGRDSVDADAQDGSGTNNANFGTPPDGRKPRMQMFIFDTVATIALLVKGVGYFSVAATFGPTAGVNIQNKAVVSVGELCTMAGAPNLTDKVALIDRGNCEFGTKVLNAETLGAVGAVVANNILGSPFAMGAGADGGSVTIPSVMVSLDDGNQMKASNPIGDADLFISDASSSPKLDSSFDAGIIAHEYCHGLSNRLTGGPSQASCLPRNSEQAGEGWSDICGLFMTQADSIERPRGVGTYVTGDPNGIRPYRYSRDMTINPLTYGDIQGLSVPHGIGSFFATCLWDLHWELVDILGWDSNIYTGSGGNNVMFQLMVEGMKSQPCSPNFIESRDGILTAAAALYPQYKCLIWQVFARRGLGEGASSQSTTSISVTEDFTVPSTCSCGNGLVDAGEDCDGVNIGSETCQGLGFAPGGTLACGATCSYDTTGCIANCGNGVVDAGEDCDGVNIGSDTCQSLGFAPGGSLTCGATCSYDTSGCIDANCGNGVVDAGEDCDGANIPGTCAGLGQGFDGGTLACNGSCGYDTSGCTTSSCVASGAGRPCTHPTACCSGQGNCTRKKKADRVCI